MTSVAISRIHQGTLPFATRSRSARSSAHAVSAAHIATVMVPRVIACLSYRVVGKPRSTSEVAGSGHLDVTTLPRV